MKELQEECLEDIEREMKESVSRFIQQNMEYQKEKKQTQKKIGQQPFRPFSPLRSNHDLIWWEGMGGTRFSN